MAKYKDVAGKVVKVKKEWSHSDKVQMIVLVYTILVNVVAIVFAFINRAESVWWYLLPSTGALGAGVIGSITWKEKAENLLKIQNNPNYDAEQLQNQVEYEIQQQLLDLHRDDTHGPNF